MKTSKRPLIVCNWKLYLGVNDSRTLANACRTIAQQYPTVELWVVPSPVCLPAVSEELRGSSVQSGSQNICWQEHGAFTGETSIGQLRELNCSFCLVGHSERRRLANEGADLVAQRCALALKHKLTTIFCVGESRQERDQGRMREVLTEQLSPLRALFEQNVNLSSQSSRLVFAYEPVWAIGTGQAAALAQIREAHRIVCEIWGAAAPVLYGGSVSAENVSEILALEEVAGALVGGASADANKLSALIQAIA